MRSNSYRRWNTLQAKELNEVEQAHRALGGDAPGRRFTTRQVNHAYVLLLSAQFQRFCRDLHSECTDFLASQVSPVNLRPIIRRDLLLNRQLDRRNAHPSSIGADFGRLGIAVWPELKRLLQRTEPLLDSIKQLIEWRNAIAHYDIDPVKLNPPKLQLSQIRRWRRACEQLAKALDTVMRDHLKSLTNADPW